MKKENKRTFGSLFLWHLLSKQIILQMKSIKSMHLFSSANHRSSPHLSLSSPFITLFSSSPFKIAFLTCFFFHLLHITATKVNFHNMEIQSSNSPWILSLNKASPRNPKKIKKMTPNHIANGECTRSPHACGDFSKWASHVLSLGCSFF